MYVKLHKNFKGEVLAVCDKELIGKKFIGRSLKLEVTKRFYKGEKKSKEEIEALLKAYGNINLVGKKAVKVALDLGIIDKESVIKVKGIPHAHIYSL